MGLIVRDVSKEQDITRREDLVIMAAPNTLKNTTLRSDEFTCPSCISKIENKLNGLDGVESTEVKFSSGRILVAHDPQKVSVRDLVDAVAEVGYTAKPSAI